MTYFHHPAHEEHIKRNIKVSSGPAFLTIVSAGMCNLKCMMCIHSVVDKIEINLDVERIYPLLKTAGRVQLVGGEPLWITANVNNTTRKILDKILKDFKNIRLSVITNGVMLNKKMAKIVFERFESINFSIDTLDKMAYKKIRSKPVLNKVLKNIEYLSNLKRKAKRSPRDNPKINFFTIVMNSTLDSLPLLTRKIAELGGFQHVLQKLRNFIGPEFEKQLLKEMPDFQKIPKSRLNSIRNEMKKISSEFGVEILDNVHLFSDGTAETPKSGSRNSVCPNPWKHFLITENGNVIFCCTNTTILGNINTQSIEEIWNGPVALDIRKSFIQRRMKGCMRKACMAPMDYFLAGKPNVNTKRKSKK